MAQNFNPYVSMAAFLKYLASTPKASEAHQHQTGMDLFATDIYPYIVECQFGSTQIRFLPDRPYLEIYFKDDVARCLIEHKRTNKIPCMLEFSHKVGEKAMRMFITTAINEDFDLLWDLVETLGLSDEDLPLKEDNIPLFDAQNTSNKSVPFLSPVDKYKAERFLRNQYFVVPRPRIFAGNFANRCQYRWLLPFTSVEIADSLKVDEKAQATYKVRIHPRYLVEFDDNEEPLVMSAFSEEPKDKGKALSGLHCEGMYYLLSVIPKLGSDSNEGRILCVNATLIEED